jgi:hypothetical protein
MDCPTRLLAPNEVRAPTADELSHYRRCGVPEEALVRVAALTVGQHGCDPATAAEAAGVEEHKVVAFLDREHRAGIAATETAAEAWEHHGQPEQAAAARREAAQRRVALSRWRATMAGRGLPTPRAPRTAPQPRARRPRSRSTRQRGPDDDDGGGDPEPLAERRPRTSRERAIRALRGEQEHFERLAERRERAGDIAGRARAAEQAQAARRAADALEGRRS